MNPFELRDDTFDVLRIIAKDARGLPPSDREVIRSAADELEQVYRALHATQLELLESQARRIATNEQLIEARKVNPAPDRTLWHPIYSGPLNGYKLRGQP